MQPEVRRTHGRRLALAVTEGLATLVVISLVAPSAAHAYIDPGSGALIWQALLAAAFGGLFYFRRALGQVKAWFAGKKKAQEPPADPKESPRTP